MVVNYFWTTKSGFSKFSIAMSDKNLAAQLKQKDIKSKCF